MATIGERNMRTDGRCILQALLCAILGMSLFAYAPAFALDNSDCLDCHGNESIVTRGGKRLHIDPLQFAKTSHSLIGCVECHNSVTERHPSDGTRPSRATCKECHEIIAQEYTSSLHGRNAVCADCHNPHQARKLIYVSGVDINAMCSTCHTTPVTMKSHEKWLPQTALHLNALPCITCHTGSKSYYINMFIERKDQNGDFRLATYAELVQLISDSTLSSLIDTNGDNFISQLELRKFNKKVRDEGMRLRGMVMPEVMTHNYQILKNRLDCTFCHASGSKAMQSSFVSFPTKSGSYNRMAVEKGAVLDILYGTPDFYMTGATRSKALSIIGAIIIICGLIMPVGHGFVRFLTRKKRGHEALHAGKEVIVYMQPISIRIWHWIHALCIITLCLTGVQIRFPEAVNMFGSYKSAIGIHNAAGIVTTVSMVFWVFYYVVISHTIGRIYFPTGEDIKHGLLRQVVFYFFNYFRGKPSPFHATPANKFNALQKLAYLVIMLIFMPLVIATGLLLLDIQPLRDMLFTLGGVKLVDGLHFLTASCLCAFVFTHFYLTTLGPTPFSEIRTMWTGYEKEEEPEEAPPPAT
jgi:predicted CXXCH cytochrome family protein